MSALYAIKRRVSNLCQTIWKHYVKIIAKKKEGIKPSFFFTTFILLSKSRLLLYYSVPEDFLTRCTAINSGTLQDRYVKHDGPVS